MALFVQPGAWVTLLSGHMGDTPSLLSGARVRSLWVWVPKTT